MYYNKKKPAAPQVARRALSEAYLGDLKKNWRPYLTVSATGVVEVAGAA